MNSRFSARPQLSPEALAEEEGEREGYRKATAIFDLCVIAGEIELFRDFADRGLEVEQVQAELTARGLNDRPQAYPVQSNLESNPLVLAATKRAEKLKSKSIN